MRKIIYCVVIIVCMMIVYTVINIDINSNVNVTSFSQYAPFLKDSEYTEENRISENLPTIDVATALYPLASEIVEKTYSAKSYNNELKIVSTNKVYEDVVNGIADIGIVTTPSDEQKKLIENSGKDIKFVKIDSQNLIFYINRNNKINSLTIEQIQKIYSGSITNWKQVEGKNTKIITYQLEKNNGSQTCFEQIVKNNKIDFYHRELKDMGDIVKKTSESKFAIGYSFEMFYDKIYNSDNLKKIAINGIYSYEGNYPLKYDVLYIYDENNKNENIQTILGNILK